MRSRVPFLLTAAAALVLPACSDIDPVATQPEVVGVFQRELTEPPHHALARLLARSLQDPQIRARLYEDIHSSNVREKKLHLRSYLRGNGGNLLAAAAREGMGEPGDVVRLVEAIGSLEIYFPWDEHRSKWEGGEDLIVATLLNDDGSERPFAVTLDGREIPFVSSQTPATPTLAIVPAESFTPTGMPLARAFVNAQDLNPDPCPPDMFPCDEGGSGPTYYTGVWVTNVQLCASCVEDGLYGDPELEFYVHKLSTRHNLACYEEDSTPEPWRWNMNHQNYSKDFLIAWEDELPLDETVAFAIYEDDDTRCVIKQDKDYLKLAADAIAQFGAGEKAWQERNFGQAGMSLLNAAAALVSFFESEDDFVGITSGSHDIDGTARPFTLRSETYQWRGEVHMVWKRDYARYGD